MSKYTYRIREYPPGTWGGTIHAGLEDGSQPLVDTKSGVKTPKFWYLKTSGATLPVTAYSRTVRPRGFARTRVNWSATRRTTINNRIDRDYEVNDYGLITYLPDGHTLSGWYATERADLRNRVRAKLQDKLINTDFDLPVFLGEGKETVSLLANTVRKTAHYLDDFRRSNRGLLSYAQSVIHREYSNPGHSPNLRKLARDLNDLHLQFTYGWKPLAGDVEDAYDLVVKTLSPQLHSKKAAYDFFVQKKRTVKSVTTLGAKIDYADIVEYKYELWMGGLLKNPEAFDSLPTRLGANYAVVPLTMWELLRFSFLVDYVTNMQSFIGNLAFSFLKLEPSTLYESSKLTATAYVKVDGVKPYYDSTSVGTINNYAIHGVQKQSHFNFSRKPLTWQDLVVRFQLEVPSRAQLVNAASVLYASVDRASRGVYRT